MNKTAIPTEYTAPSGFIPQYDPDTKEVICWDGPALDLPGRGYRVEVSWTPSEGVNFYVRTDEEGMGYDDMEHLRVTLEELATKYRAHSVTETQWCDILAFDTEGAMVHECIDHATEVGVSISAATAVWQLAGRFEAMQEAARQRIRRA